jgi:hypothetical protein
MRLKRVKSKLVFQLRVQEFVELIKDDSILTALKNAQEHLVPFAADHLAEFKAALALLVFRKDTTCPRYRRLLADERWRELADLFLAELLRTNNLSPVPLLELQLQVRGPCAQKQCVAPTFAGSNTWTLHRALICRHAPQLAMPACVQEAVKALICVAGRAETLHNTCRQA